MADCEEVVLGEWTVRIDRRICVGFGDCIEVAPEAFDLDEEGIAVFAPAVESLDREVLLEACRSCPVDAITAHDSLGRQLAP